MQLSRRALIRSGSIGLGALGVSALAGCSTSSRPASDASGEEMVMWIWPEGFAQEVLDSASKAVPDRRLRQDVIGGDFKQKLTTTFTAGTGLPDITGVKGEDIAFFRQHEKYFVDLNTLGADKLKGTYLDWKWAQATTADGKQLGIPIDIGPTALFYRSDVFESAGLPSDPSELAAAIRTWEEYIALGQELLAAKPETYLVRNSAGLFDIVWPQSGQGFVDETGRFVGDGEHIRRAWDVCVSALNAGVVARVEANTADAAAAVNEGRMPADLGASWHLADLMSDAPETSGLWHVCLHPGRSINFGGSFLTVPAGATDPELSMKFITEILSPSNLAAEYVHSGNLPAAPAALDDPRVSGPVEFLGGQEAAKVFGEAAETVEVLFEDPNSSTVEAPFVAQLNLVESSGKDSDQAWRDAVDEARRIAEQVGLTV